MIITINDGIRVATPSDDMFLCNEIQKIICKKVYLGINANEEDWKDITELEKEYLENLWNSEEYLQEGKDGY